MNAKDEHNDADAALSSAADCREPWWGLDRANKSLVAFQLGRLSNQLRWQMEQAWLLLTDQRNRLVDRVLGQIIAEAGHLPLDAAESIQAAVDDVRHRWQDNTESIAAAEELQDLAEKLRGDDRYSRSELCRQTISAWVDPLVTDLREALKSVVQEEEWPFVAGETLDQGLRPRDPYQHMYQIGASGIPDISKIEQYGVGSRPVEEEKPRRLVNYAPRPGEIPVAEGWPDRLRVACERAGIPATTLKPIMDCPSEVSMALAIKSITETDANIRAHLEASDWCHGSDEEKPAEYKFGPLEGMKQDLAKATLHGQKDERGLKSAARAGRLWIRRIGRYAFQVWFRDEKQFERASKLLEEIQSPSERD